MGDIWIPDRALTIQELLCCQTCWRVIGRCLKALFMFH
jgi:hypothetical protein